MGKISGIGVILAAMVALPLAAEEPADPFAWLEQVEGEKAMAWVKEQNRKSTGELEKVREYGPTYKRTLEIVDSKEKIPWPSIQGNWIYNFWQDAGHERGIWRRTTLDSYRTKNPAWETVLDLDELGKKEGVAWTFGGSSCLPPRYEKCIVSLSRGGSDASIWREFDAVGKKFVPGGFELPEAKSSLAWRDENTLWVGTDFGPGSLTSSGYPRTVRLWKRGTPLAEAKTIFEGESEDVAAGAWSIFTPEGRYDFVSRTPAFFKGFHYMMLGDRLVRLDFPEDASFQGIFKERFFLSLRSDWKVGGKEWKQGSLLSIGIDRFLRGDRDFDLLYEPTERSSFGGMATTRNRVLLTSLDNVRTKIESLIPEGNGWKREPVALPGLGTASIVATSDEEDLWFHSYDDFLTPDTLFLNAKGKCEALKSLPAFFDPAGMTVEQHEATSKDGTKVPYFLVLPKGFVANGNAPTILYGYGGFESPEVPYYSAVRGSAWLARGGVLAISNGRGGGEFGPRWHQAAIRENRIRSFEDFIAVADDLLARKVTSPKHLGIQGGSQGGLLVGGAMTLRPELFGAVDAQIPLADMRNYHRLLAGASWMSEYGNPDKPEDWAFIKTWSPYHLLRKDARYPRPFYWTTTRDDRVHPAHARKMVAKMLDLGHDALYFENIEGGHGSGSVNRQKARTIALEYAYFWKMLK
jgi:prolyl oligopeptidase